MVWHVDLWHFLLYSGFRIREAARLRWKHVHFDRGVIDLHEQKSGKAGTAVLGSKAQAVLESIAESRPHRSPNEYVFSAPHTRCESRNIDSFCIHRGQTFKRFRERVIPDRKLTTHSLRHGFCTLLAKAGCSAYQIKEAARHANVSTSERYVSLAKTDVRAAVNGAL
jgi:integrase/recombinase XerD